MTKKEYRSKLRMQRLMGFVLLIISIIIIAVAANGDPSNPMTTDATAVLITLPMSIYSIVTTKIFIL